MELIKALIVFGADVEIHNDLGETPGLIAARTSKGKRDERDGKRYLNCRMMRGQVLGQRGIQRLD